MSGRSDVRTAAVPTTPSHLPGWERRLDHDRLGTLREADLRRAEAVVGLRQPCERDEGSGYSGQWGIVTGGAVAAVGGGLGSRWQGPRR